MDTPYVPAWIGANLPSAHRPEYSETGGLAVEALRDNSGALDKTADQPAAQRIYRPGIIPGSLTANQPASVAGNTAAESAALKLGPGTPNYDGNLLDTQNPAGPQNGALRPIPETARDTRDDVTPDSYAGLIAQPRAGSTSLDNTRESQLQRTFLIRPFDKLISEHPSALGRPMGPPPFAARPRQYATPINDPFPSAGGAQATNGHGGGVAVQSQPNTQRLIPNDWDEMIVNSNPAGTDPAQAAVSAQRSAGWRAR